MANLLYGSQNFSTTLNVGGGIDDSQTTGIVLNTVTGLNTGGGILAFDWSTTINPDVIEYVEYGGLSGNELTGVVRGAEGVSAKSHDNGCTIVAIASKSHVNRINDKLRGVDATLATDSNGNEIIKTASNASAVNEITVTNAATGNAPTIASTGGDTNIDLTLSGKGTGKVRRDASYGTITSDSDGATVTFNMATSNLHTVTLGGNRTLAVSNVSVGQTFIIRLVQDGTGSRTVTWFSTIKWSGGVAPTLTTTLNKTDVFGFLCTSSGNYDGFTIDQNL
jgi:hypothetical protein